MHPHFPAEITQLSPATKSVHVPCSPKLQFLRDVQRGLAKRRKELQCKYLYDERGSHLFDQICELDEYYPTRTETAIMQEHAASMAEYIGRDAMIVEYGSGSSSKTRLLLEQLITPTAYLPVDISEDYLHRVAERLRSEYRELTIQPIVADFTTPFRLPANLPNDKVCVYFPGSTIGNLVTGAARRLLHQIAKQCSARGGLLIGIDLEKDPAVLRRAYDDSQGVTAEFNLNLLHRINRELGATFIVDEFEHRIEVNEEQARVELYLESRCDQTVEVGNDSFRFHAGERILTEYSHKYRLSEFLAMAGECGLRLEEKWTDRREYFAVLYLRVDQEG